MDSAVAVSVSLEKRWNNSLCAEITRRMMGLCSFGRNYPFVTGEGECTFEYAGFLNYQHSVVNYRSSLWESELFLKYRLFRLD